MNGLTWIAAPGLPAARLCRYALAMVLLLAALGARAGELAQAFKRVSASVVVVLTEQTLPAADAAGGARLSAQGLGSGVLVSAGGVVMTAAHVVQCAERVVVSFADGQSVPAQVLASDPVSDLAVLKLARVPAGAVVARLGDSDQVDVADQVFVVGAPFGVSRTLTVGHVSARREPGEPGAGLVDAELFQTDAAINHGNSGGPMFNLKGEVIGIVSHMLSESGGSDGIGFAVTSKEVRQLLDDPFAFWSGMRTYPLQGSLAAALNLPQPAGLLLLQRAENSVAARLGLRAGALPARFGETELLLGGDVILAVGELRIEPGMDAYRRIQNYLRRIDPAAPLVLSILRDGQVIALGATPGELVRIAP
ncbi:MAG: trypsin-like peptidase domain-containing protein [Rhodocyclaceae bacterium]|nr:trypsin-like peptidase domain-containing protein [Rhodocyclaceae bacterium]